MSPKLSGQRSATEEMSTADMVEQSSEYTVPAKKSFMLTESRMIDLPRPSWDTAKDDPDVQSILGGSEKQPSSTL